MSYLNATAGVWVPIGHQGCFYIHEAPAYGALFMLLVVVLTLIARREAFFGQFLQPVLLDG